MSLYSAAKLVKNAKMIGNMLEIFLKNCVKYYLELVR